MQSLSPGGEMATWKNTDAAGWLHRLKAGPNGGILMSY
jgi:hypothetical protein